jgi:hypothetical protein
MTLFFRFNAPAAISDHSVRTLHLRSCFDLPGANALCYSTKFPSDTRQITLGIRIYIMIRATWIYALTKPLRIGLSRGSETFKLQPKVKESRSGFSRISLSGACEAPNLQTAHQMHEEMANEEGKM